jgi:hypothetical protein
MPVDVKNIFMKGQNGKFAVYACISAHMEGKNDLKGLFHNSFFEFFLELLDCLLVIFVF